MHVRVTNIAGAKDIDQGVAFLAEKVVPALSGQQGYRGLTASADRSSGALGVLSLWDTEADLEASESTASKSRQEALEIIGGEVSVETFEQFLLEVGDTPPTPGCRIRIQRISVDPARVDEHFAFFKSEVLPQIKAGAGFRALRHMMNRKTGEGIVGTVWSDDASMDAEVANAQSRRQIGEGRGVKFGEASLREVLFSDLR